jgi:hypothetical protein
MLTGKSDHQVTKSKQNLPTVDRFQLSIFSNPITKNRITEPRITQSEFLSLKFKNGGIPDIMYLYVYLLFGERILDYFVNFRGKRMDSDKLRRLH